MFDADAWMDCKLPECENCQIPCVDDCAWCACPIIKDFNIKISETADTIRLKGVNND